MKIARILVKKFPLSFDNKSNKDISKLVTSIVTK